jgi:hypothetical protein
MIISKPTAETTPRRGQGDGYGCGDSDGRGYVQLANGDGRGAAGGAGNGAVCGPEEFLSYGYGHGDGTGDGYLDCGGHGQSRPEPIRYECVAENAGEST